MVFIMMNIMMIQAVQSDVIYEITLPSGQTMYGYVRELDNDWVEVVADMPWLSAPPKKRYKRSKITYKAELVGLREKRIPEEARRAGFTLIETKRGARWHLIGEVELAKRSRQMAGLTSVPSSKSKADDIGSGYMDEENAVDYMDSTAEESRNPIPWIGQAVIVLLACALIGVIVKTLLF